MIQQVKSVMGKEIQDMTNNSINNLTRLLKATLAVMLIVMVLSCSKKDPELVGIWENTSSPEIVEFKPDGSGVFTYPKRQIPPLVFFWKQAEKNNYVLEVNFLGDSRTLTATVNDKGMSIQSNTGRELYKRQISR